MSDDLTSAQHAAAIDAARQRLGDFIGQCTDEQWLTSPADGDPRPAGVIADHVAHAYEYLAGWMTETLSGGSPEINLAIVDELNAAHAAGASAITRSQVLDHLKTSGDVLISLVSGLDPAHLELGEGRVRRLAIIAARHADSHRDELETGLRS
ncbi:MAG TPA: DinB family protein [Streptosporangiaceae bacterium]|nr:DinB family protein [Streptosporangiaceae bacterium]